MPTLQVSGGPGAGGRRGGADACLHNLHRAAADRVHDGARHARARRHSSHRLQQPGRGEEESAYTAQLLCPDAKRNCTEQTANIAAKCLAFGYDVALQKPLAAVAFFGPCIRACGSC